MGGSRWSKAKTALGLKINSCLYVSRTLDDSPPPSAATPPSSSALRSTKRSSKSSKNVCAICLGSMKPGHGHAIFTAECSHTFHFPCIASNVKHGRQSCPICRANWKEVPFPNPSADNSHGRDRAINTPWLPESPLMQPVRHIPARVDINRNVSSLFYAVEPHVFADDDEISISPSNSTTNRSSNKLVNGDNRTVEVKTYPEVSAVPKEKSHDDFSVLVHLKAPSATATEGSRSPLKSPSSRAPVDLVTVLDISGSMAGSKLALLKRAMGFVIQNLGPNDRLSVVAFSSTARRLFPLRRMTDSGKHEALQSVNSLTSKGGTNIADGLKKGAKVMTERRRRNPVSSIVLLSDGQDTYTRADPQSLVPPSMHRSNVSGLHIPIHTFGFGADHDAVAMHSISETSGGTFSFIETEDVMQDAFAQCIGGLLSVVVQELKLEVSCIDHSLQLTSIKSGNYRNVTGDDKRTCSIEVGDLYADEERDFLITTDIPIARTSKDMNLVKVKCVYKHPVSKNLIMLDSVSTIKIRRPVSSGTVEISMEVDRQRNRIRSAEAMAEARGAAEHGNLTSAISILENSRKQLSETASARAGDRLCTALDAEMKEIQERMVNWQTYEASGRAYVLSGLSSHSWQRATARGDSTENTSAIQAYQTQSMTDMVHLSQTMVLGIPTPRRTGPETR